MAKVLQSPEDIAFIRALLSAPHDDAPRLRYAVWLDEQNTDDSRNAAEYLRLLLKYQQTTSNEELQIALWKLERRLPKPWLTAIDVSRIELCYAAPHSNCPERWELLRPTKDPFLRCCDQCGNDVRYCLSLGEAALFSIGGRPVVLPSTAPRQKDDIYQAIDRCNRDL
jgi:uncharacterized protein (TIGR02996 family)